MKPARARRAGNARPVDGLTRSRMTMQAAPQITLTPVRNAEQLHMVRTLFLEYAQQLVVDLAFQGFERELASLPGEYAPPAGELLLAEVDGAPAGCSALRPLPGADHADASEMKRLYVRPAFRGFGIGRQLARRIMEIASQIGYRCVLLDTLNDMEAARALYAGLGFEEIPPYYHNPIVGAHYLKASLQ